MQMNVRKLPLCVPSKLVLCGAQHTLDTKLSDENQLFGNDDGNANES